MSKPESLTLPQLGRKFALLFAHGRKVRCAADLAVWMEVKPSTVSGWINGIKSKPGGRVRSQVLDGLCRRLAEETQGRISDVEARPLWLGQADKFEAALTRGPSIHFLEILGRSSNRLTIRLTIHDPAALGMIDDAVAIPEDAVRLKSDCQVAFEVDGVIGRLLVVLVEEQAGWRVLGPGPRHKGRIDQSPERVPNLGRPMMGFLPPFGPHRFVFLELPSELTGALPPAGSVAAVPSAALAELARQLALPSLSSNWRWGQVFFDVIA
jgi:hypothetical protein